MAVVLLSTHVGADQPPPDRNLQAGETSQPLHIPHPHPHLIGDDLQRVQLAVQLIKDRCRVDLAIVSEWHGSWRWVANEDEKGEVGVTGDDFIGRVGR
jgi:hypothetical protein